VSTIKVLKAGQPLPSLARAHPSSRKLFRVAAIQHRWHPDDSEHRSALRAAALLAAREGAELICFQELTLSRYFAATSGEAPRIEAEDLPGGVTHRFAAELARETGAFVHASLYERAPGLSLGFNTAICVDSLGRLVARTRKTHIPVSVGYYESEYFRPGNSGFPVVTVGSARLGFPTCWDQWFPEVARAYSLGGAEILVYATAIGSEPACPHFDTQPQWEKVIVGQGIANGTFMIAVNRIDAEPPLVFYGSSFISDPYGRVLVRAPRDQPAVLIADLDLDQRNDWLSLFPLLSTRRPEMYAVLICSANSVAEPMARTDDAPSPTR
jgi:N-carbamoylputrescine amidase